MKKILITSALPYVNNEPHLGNIVGCVLSADVYARYMKKNFGDNNVLFLCGTDEYGTTTEVKAKKENMTCQEICDKYHVIHKKIYEWFNIGTDVFGRTTTNKQTEIAQNIFLELYDNNYLVDKNVDQLYCEHCDNYLADRYISGYCYSQECIGKKIITKGDQCDKCTKLIDVMKLIEPKCVVCNNAPHVKTSAHLFLDLSKCEKEIRDHFIDNNKCILSKNALAITQAFIDKGLHEKPITRDLKWGTPIPTNRNGLEKFKGKVMYVWFDAPIGYLSIAENAGYDLSEYKDWILFMAKDNVPFHTIVFPATLFAYNATSHKKYPLPTNINATEYLVYEGDKFSKSNQIGVFGTDIIAICDKLKLNSDYIRYYLAKIRPETKDSSFSWNEFVTLIKGELIGTYGNFVHRGLISCQKFVDTELKLDVFIYAKELNYVSNLFEKYKNHMNNIELRDGLMTALSIADYGNKFLQENKIWELFKEYKVTNDIKLMEKIKQSLAMALYIIYISTSAFEPYLPITTKYILSHISYDNIKLTFKLNLNDYKVPFNSIDLDAVYKVLDELHITHKK